MSPDFGLNDDGFCHRKKSCQGSGGDDGGSHRKKSCHGSGGDGGDRSRVAASDFMYDDDDDDSESGDDGTGDSMDEDDDYYDYEADDHRPVSCGTVRAWRAKNASDSETANWVLTHTKHRPKCHRPIEKNQGCNHMTCSAPYYHQFC